jgi:hypothetical protein
MTTGDLHMMPLLWSGRNGGQEERRGRPVTEGRKPVGTVIRFRKGELDINGTLQFPNVRGSRTALISSWHDRPAPVGHRPVRRALAATTELRGHLRLAWQQERAPSLPLDFDARFLQLAPAELRHAGAARGGERSADGVSPAGSNECVEFHAVLRRLRSWPQPRATAPRLLDTLNGTLA